MGVPANTASGAANVHGTTVRWRSVGLGYDPVFEILAMFPAGVPGAPADVTIELGPAPQEASRDPVTEGYRETCFLGRSRGYSRESDFLLWDGASRVHVDSAGGRISGEVAPPPRTEPLQLVSVMLFSALAVALRHRGLFHLHAAALVDGGGHGWVLVGGSGSGKTTSTLALIASGFRYLGDDAVFLRTARGTREVLAFPRPFHLTAATLAAFPELTRVAGAELREGTPKRAVDPRRAFAPGTALPATCADYLLFPTVSPSACTHAVRLAPADAMSELLQSSPLVAADAIPRRLEHLTALRDVARDAPALELRLGRDTLAEPTRLAAVVSAALAADRRAG